MVDSELLAAALAKARARRALPSPTRRRRIRLSAGLSQLDVAQALGVTREAVALWERGRRTPRAGTAADYAGLLDRLTRESTKG